MLDSIFVFALLFCLGFFKPKFPSTCLEDLLKSLSKSSTQLEHFWRISVTNKSTKMDSN